MESHQDNQAGSSTRARDRTGSEMTPLVQRKKRVVKKRTREELDFDQLSPHENLEAKDQVSLGSPEKSYEAEEQGHEGQRVGAEPGRKDLK